MNRQDRVRAAVLAAAFAAMPLLPAQAGDFPSRPVRMVVPYPAGGANDIVARLGMLAPNGEAWDIELDGAHYRRRRAWGHLLNEHYLFPIEEYQRAGRRKGGAGGSAPFELLNPEVVSETDTPRLYQYINGGR